MGSPDPTHDPHVVEGRERNALDGLLPEADVDSNWWYWIAAVPAYFALTLLLFGLALVLFLFGLALDLAGGMGFATLSLTALFAIAAVVVALPALLLAVLFPVAMYVDARAVERAAVGWSPDPVLYGVAALAAVLVTNFVLSVPLACYYLYKRHGAVGRP